MLAGVYPSPAFLEGVMETDRVCELLEQLLIAGYYQIGLTAFFCGMLLGFIFIFGLRLR